MWWKRNFPDKSEKKKITQAHSEDPVSRGGSHITHKRNRFRGTLTISSSLYSRRRKFIYSFFLFFTDLIYYNGQIEDYEGRKVEGVGVMKDDELKFEESEVSHILRGVGGVTRGEGRGEGVGLFYYKR